MSNCVSVSGRAACSLCIHNLLHTRSSTVQMHALRAVHGVLGWCMWLPAAFAASQVTGGSFGQSLSQMQVGGASTTPAMNCELFSLKYLQAQHTSGPCFVQQASCKQGTLCDRQYQGISTVHLHQGLLCSVSRESAKVCSYSKVFCVSCVCVLLLSCRQGELGQQGIRGEQQAPASAEPFPGIRGDVGTCHNTS
jgi:hypothetical protein